MNSSLRKLCIAAASLIFCVEVTQLFWELSDLSNTKYRKREIPYLKSAGRDLARFFNKRNFRNLSINLGGGECIWTPAKATGSDKTVFGTLLAAYPGSGMRLLWQHAESLTGILVGDDYNYNPDSMERGGIMKTQYPHFEGEWIWENKMDQVVLIVRSPRWALPSYHDLIAELHYADKWETVVQYIPNIYTKHATFAEWKRWRDYRFHDEMLLYKWFIDYWMEGGKQYWTEYDFERIGEKPFLWIPEAERNKTDIHCIEDLDCFPKAIIDYDLLRDPASGATEANKLANVLDGKMGVTVIEHEARQCLWYKTEEKLGVPDEVRSGSNPSEYTFTCDQYIEMREMLVELHQKYSSGEWVYNTLANDLTGYLWQYIEELNTLIDAYKGGCEADMSPTAAPNDQHQKELKEWYDKTGRGNRYGVYKIMEMKNMWPLVQHMYEKEHWEIKNTTNHTTT